MGWQDDPVVSQPAAANGSGAAWESDPIVTAYPATTESEQPAQQPQATSFVNDLGRAAAMQTGAAVKGAASLVALPTDTIVRLLNLAGVTNWKPASQSIDEAIDSIVPAPRNATERVTNRIVQTLASGGAGVGIGRALGGAVGAALSAQPGRQLTGAVTGGASAQGAAEMGAGTVGQVVAGVVGGGLGASVGRGAPIPSATPPTVAQQTLAASQKAGYVVPPTTTNPTMFNRMAEGVAGKLTTAQMASAKNTAITNRLVKAEMGIAENAPITKEAIREIRDDAGKVYGAISRAGEITADETYQQGVQGLGSLTNKISASFGPKADAGAREQIGDLVESLGQKSFSADDGLEYVKQLRENSRGNLSKLNTDPAKKALGRAQKKAADLIEEQILRHLKANGEEFLANQFTKAREKIAKTYTIEAALNPSTGNVSAIKLAAQMAKGKPVSGNLKTVAEFGQAFPKAGREFNESIPGISPLDVVAGAGLGAGVNPALAFLPLTRVVTRAGLLSPYGQKLAIAATPRSSEVPASFARTAGAVYGSLDAQQPVQ